MAPFLFVDRVARGLTIDMFGDGSSERDYTHVSDITQGVLKVLDHPPGATLAPPSDPLHAPRHEVYNLGRGSPTTLRDFIATIGRVLASSAPPGSSPPQPPRIRILPRQPGDVERTMADISKARRMVGYEPTVSVEEGIKATVAWYREEVLNNPLEEIERQQQQQQQQQSRNNTASDDDPASPASAAAVVPVASAVATPPSAFSALQSCLCATRIHNAGSGRVGLSPDVLAHLLSWLPRALACAQWVAIAVDATGGRQDIAQAVRRVLAGELCTPAERARVAVVEVAPWGAFCPALNALLAHAQSLRASTVLFSSLEMQMHPAHVGALSAHMDPSSTLVVGARLPGHRFVRGTAELDGCSTVWNTLALWNTAKLARTGFLPISDGVPARTETVIDTEGKTVDRVVQPAVAAGVEEVACISAQQLLFPDTAEAKLLSMSTTATKTGCSNAVPLTKASVEQQCADDGIAATTSGSSTEDTSALSSPTEHSSTSSSHNSSSTDVSGLSSPIGGAVTTSAAESPNDDEDEDDASEDDGPQVCHARPSGAVVARVWPLSSANDSAASLPPQLYDEAPTPPSGLGVKRLQKRTVSAPHASAAVAGLSRLRSGSCNNNNTCSPLLCSIKTPSAAIPSSCSLSSSSSFAPAPVVAATIPSLHWDSDFGGDAARQDAHERKMRSKVERAAQQLAHLQMKPGTVQHIHCRLNDI
jgi:hypothetical protein